MEDLLLAVLPEMSYDTAIKGTEVWLSRQTTAAYASQLNAPFSRDAGDPGRLGVRQ